MSKSEPRRSGRARVRQENASVYDFLYHDARRVASFLAQFNDAGHPQQVKQTDSVTKGSTDKGGFSGGVNVGIAKFGGATDTSVTQEGTEESERTYDPLWANALTLLDFLEQKRLIQRNISRARIGQIVLASGGLHILDTRILADLMSIPTLKDAMTASMAQNALAQIEASDEPNEMKELRRAAVARNSTWFIDALHILPHGIQCIMTTGSNVLWGSLAPENLITPVPDLVLKHGATIEGEWAIVGILDALPNADHQEPLALPDIMFGGIGTFSSMIEAISQNARAQFGRAPVAHGITPLLIFREVSG
jgi:hypothetical protein